MGNTGIYYYYNQIKPMRSDEIHCFSSDISCIIEPSEGKGGLYLGNLTAANNCGLLKYYGVASVVTVAVEAKVESKGVLPYYLKIDAYDSQLYSIKQNLKECIKFIKSTLKKTNVLVHCMKGISRSVAVVIGYLIAEHNISFKKALEYVKQKRPISDPNYGFVIELEKFEEEVRQGKKSGKENQVITKTLSKNYEQDVLKLQPFKFSAVQY